MVLKRGCTSGLTIGCLNNFIHGSIHGKAFKTKPCEYSVEVAPVLPRMSKSGVFSESGDSGPLMYRGLTHLHPVQWLLLV